MPCHLIINAYDLGLAPGVTDAILDLAQRGRITSTSALMNLPGSSAALRRAREINLDVGLHLNICTGPPLSPPESVRSLLSNRSRTSARFASAAAIQRRALMGQLALDEVEREWSAQIERFLAAGVTPTHLDSHCHLHALPRLYQLSQRLAARHGIPGLRRAYSKFILRPPHMPVISWITGSARRRLQALYQPDYFSVLTVMGPARTPRPLHALLRTLPDGVTELVCHPGYVDDELRSIDTLTRPREREWLLLSRAHLPAALERENIRLVSWRDAVAWR